MGLGFLCRVATRLKEFIYGGTEHRDFVSLRKDIRLNYHGWVLCLGYKLDPLLRPDLI